jgi:hypothetical protein
MKTSPKPAPALCRAQRNSPLRTSENACGETFVCTNGGKLSFHVATDGAVFKIHKVNWIIFGSAEDFTIRIFSKKNIFRILPFGCCNLAAGMV